MHRLMPDHWYLMFVCKDCEQRQVLFPDLSLGEATINATYTVDCAYCHHNNAYESENIERYHHPALAKAVTA